MTRKTALEVMKVALLKGDTSKATQVYIENRISRSVYYQYYGRFYRKAGAENVK